MNAVLSAPNKWIQFTKLYSKRKELQQQEVLLTLSFKPHPLTCVIHLINDQSNHITDSSQSGAFISESHVSSLMIDMIRGYCVAIKEQCLTGFMIVDLIYR